MSTIAGMLSKRYTNISLLSIIADIALLSECNFFVGTFSSNVGTAVYELMQARQGDISHCVNSLDGEYWYIKSYEPYKIAVEDNVLSNKSLPQELALRTGDMIYIISKGRKSPEGYSEGRNKRTRQRGIYPLNKAVDYVFTYVAPNYEAFDRQL